MHSRRRHVLVSICSDLLLAQFFRVIGRRTSESPRPRSAVVPMFVVVVFLLTVLGSATKAVAFSGAVRRSRIDHCVCAG